jgi:hypothetical protein
MDKYEQEQKEAKKRYEKLMGLTTSGPKRKKQRTWWTRISTNLWRELMKDLKPIQRSIYVSLKLYASNEGYCYPSNRLLAKELNVDKDTILENIKILEKKGWIKIIKTKTLKGLSNNYTLLK